MNRRGPKIFALTVRGAGDDARSVAVDRFPFVIGRAHDASLRLEASGVWNQHLILDLDPAEGLMASPGSGALVTLDGGPISKHRIRNGEELTLGSIRLQFVLSPVARRRIGLWEVAVWLLLLSVAAVQVVIAWRILDL